MFRNEEGTVKQRLLIALISIVAVLGGSAFGAPAALGATATVPAAPAGLTATPGNATVVLAWSAPADGGSPITGYNLYEGTSSGGENYAAPVNGKTLITATSTTVTGLTNSKAYYFTVKAVNAVGSSGPSNEAWTIPAATVPGPPRNVSAAAAYESATVTWTAPASQGGANITAYKVAAADLTLASRGGQSCSWTGGPLSCVLTGLTDGDTYSFTVTATNSLGTGVASLPSNSVVPAATAPAAPTSLVATPGNGTVALSWAAPASNGGSALTGYNLYESATAGGENYSAPVNGSSLISTTTTTVTALTNTKTYFFTVKAVNAIGSSSPSNEAWAIPDTSPTPPAMPTTVTATGAYTSAVVSWKAPVAGSSNITSYKVTSGGAQTCVWTNGPLTCTVTGLVGGTSYTFTVTATNSVGTGPASSPSSAVTIPLFTAPAAPAGLTAVPNDHSVVLSWSAPSGNGAPISGYNAYEGTTAGGEATTPVNGSVEITATTVTISSLTNGKTYYFTVKAVNGVGSSAASNEVWAIPTPTVAGAPINVTAAAGTAGTVVVSWVAPFSSGGAAVTGYAVTPYSGTTSQGARVFDSTVTTETISGLNPGESYTFEVAAINAYGTGAFSSPSGAVQVGRAYTILRIQLSKATTNYGHEQVEHISATVSPNYPGPVPTGSVSVKKSTTTLCVIELSGAKGSCTLAGTALPPGTYSVYATYSRNASFVGSTSPKSTLVVDRQTTRIALELSSTKVTFGDEQVERFLVDVSESYASGPSPTGTVSIKKSTTTLCLIKLTAGKGSGLTAGKGSCTLTSRKLPPGTFSVYATYARNTDFVGASSARKTLTVFK